MKTAACVGYSSVDLDPNGHITYVDVWYKQLNCDSQGNHESSQLRVYISWKSTVNLFRWFVNILTKCQQLLIGFSSPFIFDSDPVHPVNVAKKLIEVFFLLRRPLLPVA